MVNIIQSPYQAQSPIGQVIADLGQSLFGDRLGGAVKREQLGNLKLQAESQRLENEGKRFKNTQDVEQQATRDQQAEYYRSLNGQPINIGESLANTTRMGAKIEDAGTGALIYNSNTFGPADRRTQGAQIGTGLPFGSTAGAFDQELAEKRRQFDQTPEQALRDGKSVFVPRSGVFAPGVEPIVAKGEQSPAQRYDAWIKKFPGDDAGAKTFAAGGGPSTVINNGAGENSFEKRVGEKQADFFAELANDGVNARTDRALLDRLGDQMKDLPGGMFGGLQALASDYGIKVGNADNVEAAQAIIARLVPAARQGLPGAASDRDVALFKQSLPSLSQTPAGRDLVTGTLMGLARVREEQARIAAQAMAGTITRSQAMAALQDLPDPFVRVREAADKLGLRSPESAPGAFPGPGPMAAPQPRTNDAPPAGISADEWSHMTAQERAVFQ